MTEQLWAAIDAITKPTSKPVFREGAGDLINDLADREKGLCHVAEYRNSMVGHGTIPSLWEQAEMALYKTGETLDGNRSPLATRSPADVALMEIMLTVREQLAAYFSDLDEPVPASSAVPAKLRHLASDVIRNKPNLVDEWTYRIGQFRRLLETHLQALDRGPRPMRLRTRCPVCKTGHLTIEDPDGAIGKDGKPLRLLIRPILAVYRDHWFRCFECEACLTTWFAGSGVHDLKALIEADDLSEHETITA